MGLYVNDDCPSAEAPTFRGLHLVASDAASPDIHSNSIESLGLSSACERVGIQVDLAPGATSATSGMLRNNIISAGQCSTRVALSLAASASLKALQNNDLYGPQEVGAPASTVLCRQGNVDATTPAQVNAIPLAAGNLSAAPQYSAYPNDLRLTDGSPCLDTGTGTGAPTSDGAGQARPAGDGYDIGAYELSL